MPAGARGHYNIQCYARWHEIYQKNELDSDPHVKICGYQLYTYIWLIILFRTEKV